MNYLDKTGLTYLWSKIKSKITVSSSSNIVIWIGTSAQYEAIATKQSNTLYFILE